MAWSDYQSALSTLRTHITNDAWDDARKQVLICRTWLAEEAKSGSLDGAAYQIAVEQLDALSKGIPDLKSATVNTGERFAQVRLNYESR